MNPAAVVALGLLGAVIGAWLEIPVRRVPEKVPLGGDTFGPQGIGPRPRPILLAIANGVLFALMADRLGTSWALPAFLVFTAASVALFAIDLETYLLPNRIVYPLTIVSVALLAVGAVGDGAWDAYLRALAGGTVTLLIFLVLYVIAPKALGFGDVKYSFTLGLFLGWIAWGEVLLGFFLGFAYGSLIGIALMVARKRGRKDPVPFGPFLVAGAMTAILWGQPIIDWYRGT